MVVTQTNGQTFYFDQPIPKVHFMKLPPCNLYNSWDTLKIETIISLVESDNTLKNVKILLEHYTLETLAKTMVEAFKKHSYEIGADT